MRLSSSAVLDFLRDSIRETFETLTFSEISEWEISRTVPAVEVGCIGAGVDLHSPRRGRFAILLNREQCRGFVETAYGTEGEGGEAGKDILQDYVSEIANTIAGRFAASVSPEGGQAVIGLPEPFTERDIPSRPDRTHFCMQFLVEETPAWCLLTWNRRGKMS